MWDSVSVATELSFKKPNMANLALVNTASWGPDLVASWLRGLDDTVLPYVDNFINANICGKQLLCLTHYDLEKLSIRKLGHQELLLEAVDLLSALNYDLESETIQSLALKLACKAKSLHNSLKAAENAGTLVTGSTGPVQTILPINVLSEISDVVCSIKSIVSWLDRPPFDSGDGYSKQRNSLVKFGMELVSSTQGENVVVSQTNIMEACLKLSQLCDSLIRDCRDPLVIQTAALELAVIRKKPEEELGMHIQSSYNGTHVIGGVKADSPADLCGKVEEGDEVVQVNYQTVIGWQLKKLVAALKENAKEVSLTLKKRPYHASIFGMHPNKHKTAKNLKQSTFPKALRRKPGDSQKGTRSSLKDFLSNVPAPPTETYSDGAQENDTDNDNDAENDEVFRGTTTSLAPEFTPLDPKQRRATVSCGSPTLKRPSIQISEFANRPRSFNVSSPSSDGSHGSPSSPGNEISSHSNDEVKVQITDASVSPITASNSKTSTSSNTSTTYTTKGSITSPTTSTPPPPSPSKASKTAQTMINRKKEKTGKGAKEVAWEKTDTDGPLLTNFTRIDSTTRRTKYEKNVNTRGDDDDTQDKENQCSYTYRYVGGVTQKVPVNAVNMRRSPHERKPRPASSRRISCRDLGGGDCNGWLWRKKEGPKFRHSKWVKQWVVLTKHDLYTYKDNNSSQADLRVSLLGLKVMDSPKTKSKKHAFKIETGQKQIIMAAEGHSDMVKWMNKMSLATININLDDKRPTEDLSHLAVSEDEYSEGSDDNSSLVSTPSSSRRGSDASILESCRPSSNAMDDTDGAVSPDDIGSILRNPKDPRGSRKSRIASILAPVSALDVRNSQDLEKSRKLSSLQRSLKDKEHQLGVIEELLKTPVITGAILKELRIQHPSVLIPINGPSNHDSPSSDSDSSSDSEPDELTRL